MVEKVLKTLVFFSDHDHGHSYLIDTVFLEGAWWLVGEWHPSHAKGVWQPKRLIRLTGLAHEEVSGQPYRFVLETPIPKAVLDGETKAGYAVVVLPAPADSPRFAPDRLN